MATDGGRWNGVEHTNTPHTGETNWEMNLELESDKQCLSYITASS